MKALKVIAGVLVGLYVLGLIGNAIGLQPAKPKTLMERCEREFPGDSQGVRECVAVNGYRELMERRQAAFDRASR